ncbi:tRNA 4-thiouridine(8) synthase ThiI [Candidatus Geothermarchaeota archaeon ex4572_27]|nr:MAG: tRNA 4-thiouridine(8) synthase ThiI [Candidatus Geothermarchaeota archaeon ex4572_27]
MSEERRLKILVRFGELTLKSDRSRRRFLRRLIQNIRDALNTLGYKYEIENLWSRLLIDVYGDINDAVEALRRVFGIHSLAIVSDRYFDGLDDLVRLGVEEFKDAVRGRSFAVRVKRVGRHNFTSMDVARLLGSELLKYADRVDLTSPDVEVRLEIRDDRVFFYHGLVKAYGGLPIGTEGVAVALVSGGFDSAVAAWYALKRGAIVHYVFCNLDGEGYKMDVIKVLKVLSDKRMMYRAAERIAKKLRAGTIITGESLGQVSSQTMKNLFVSQRAVEMPINRPRRSTGRSSAWTRRRSSTWPGRSGHTSFRPGSRSTAP